MTDHCLHEQELGAIKDCVHRLDKEMFGNGKEGLAQTVPVLSAKIDTLIETVGDLRTTVSGFVKFEAGVTASEAQKSKGFSKTAQVLALVVSFGLLFATILFNSNRTEKSMERVKDIVDQYGYDMRVRGADSLNTM